jgi:hypothetical protein
LKSDRAELVRGEDGELPAPPPLEGRDRAAEEAEPDPPDDTPEKGPGIDWGEDERPWAKSRAPVDDQPRPVLIEGESQRLVLKSPARTGLGLLGIAGAALALFGAVDILVLWFPPDFGVPAWQFGTLTRTFESAPWVGIGAALLAYAVVRYPDVEPSVVRGTGIAFMLLGALALLGGVLFALAVPGVLAEAPSQAVGPLVRSIVRTSSVVLVSLVACAALVWRLWRGVGEE